MVVTRSQTGDDAERAVEVNAPPTIPSAPTGGEGRHPQCSTRLISPTRSVNSNRSTNSVTARIRQAQFEAEERLALLKRREIEIESDIVRRKLAYDIEMLHEEENMERHAQTGERERVENWIRNSATQRPNVPEGTEPVPFLSERPTRAMLPTNERRQSPTPGRNNSRTRGIEQLVDVMEKMTKNRPPPRQSYELPVYSGAPFEWFAFKAAMIETTRTYKFTRTENMARLRNCLRGEAKDIVSAMLYTVEDPDTIMRTLEQCYGRPEVIIDKTMDELRKLPRPGTSASELNAFAVRIQNMVSILKSLDNKGYLYNPMMTRDVMDKLSPHLRSRWCDYADEHRNEADPEIMLLSRFLMREADVGLRYGYSSVAAASTFRRETVRSNTAPKETKKKAVYTATATTEAESAAQCTLCKRDHGLNKCKQFASMSTTERWDFVKKEGLCFKCIMSRHRRMNCRAKLCGEDGCRHPHHVLLHDTRAQPAAAVGSPTGGVETVTMTIAKVKEVKLKICPVVISGPRGSVSTYALLDEGSTVSLVDQEIATKIGASGPSRPLNIRGINTSQSVASELVKFNIHGTNSEKYTMRARTIPEMKLTPQNMPTELLRLDHLRDLDQDEVCYEHGKPQVLIGTDNWELIVSRELRTGRRNEPAASRTQLGWIIHGTLPKVGLCKDREDVLHIYSHSCNQNDRLEQLVEDHFKIDALGVSLKVKASAAHTRAIEIFEKTAKRKDGRFEVGLPWREDDVMMPPSYDAALRRLTTLERKLDRSLDMKTEYGRQIQNLLDKGYAELCDGSERDSPIRWYLPHFPVMNPNKPGKVRLVFDAAAKSRGVSLNDHLLEGPDLLQSLQTILFRFRERPIAITADIQEMFLQIKIRACDQPAQLFLWRGNDREQRPQEYKMTSMIFGASSSPFLAHSVRNRNALEYEKEYPEAVRAITKAHYMDDYVDSHNSEREAMKVINEVDQIHKRCGFVLRGWNSNSERVMNSMPEERRARTTTQLLSSHDGSEKTLGLQWNARHDTLGFNTSLSRVAAEVRALSRSPTKREALSAIMSLYDPLGLLSCYTITGKILLQRLWRENIGWDDALPPESAGEFTAWLQSMQTIAQLQLPRCYDPQEETVSKQLHIFVDASESAYATAAYWRMERPDGTANTVLVAAKSKVAPIRIQTIPRLELQAAVIGARLAATILREHRWTTDDVVYWTDSRTVQHWIRNDNIRYTPFVAHRLGDIAELTHSSQWSWIPTNLNVADLATRPQYVPTSAEDVWFTGPAFLREPVDTWPQCVSTEIEPQEHVEDVLHTTETQEHSLPDITRFSGYERLIRATAFILLFIDKCRKRATTMEVDHLMKAEELWMAKSQRDSFNNELELLRKGKVIPKTSKLYKLDPIIENGLLRINGRIALANVPDETKRPIILDGRHAYTRLLVHKEHRAAGHANRERVVNDLRQKYWIIKIRPTVRTATRNCALCRIRKATPLTPVMGDLPAARVAPYQRPFTNCGVDYFGPITVTIGRRHEKRWCALFTCLTTRAVHLEVVYSLSTDSAIMALRRMAARRGWPAVMYSDNGTNFKGADAELRAAYEEWAPALKEYGLQKRVSWRYIPPGAPAQGGAWERLVRSVKVALTAVLHQKAPKEETLHTVLIEAEYSINAWPLTHVSVDPSDPEAITPNHFLLGKPAELPLTGPCEPADRRVWRASQALANEFWRRWVQEYLPTLVPRQGAQTAARPLQQGDLVVVVDPTLPRNTWPRGVVERVYPGRDGLVRCADVRTRTGIFKRPTTKLAVLPIEGSAESSPGGEC